MGEQPLIGVEEEFHVVDRETCRAAPEVDVAPAALSRVAPAGSIVVNSSRGGGAKDTWVLK